MCELGYLTRARRMNFMFESQTESAVVDTAHVWYKLRFYGTLIPICQA